MFLRIETLPAKKLVGMHLSMSLAENKTFELWSKFMPRRKEIKNAIGNNLYSLQIFKPDHNQADPRATFEKWAAVEVAEGTSASIKSNVGMEMELPVGMEIISIPTGDYAVFLHQGPAIEGARTFQYIFGTWLPNSGYQIDNRPHFELLGEKYKNNDPSSEEEIWIPIR